MEVAILVLVCVLVVVVSVATAGVWKLVGQSPSPIRMSSPPAIGAPGGQVEKLPQVAEVRVADGGHAMLLMNDQVLATLSTESSPEIGHMVRGNSSMVSAIGEMVHLAPDLLRITSGSRGWTVTFSKDTLRGLADGSFKLMEGGHAAAVDGSTSRVVELGKITGPNAGLAVARLPGTLAAAAAIAAAAMQQQQLWAALTELEQGIDRVYQRQIDETSGVLRAGAELAREVVEASQSGPIPDQIARELAVARREVDAVYYARRAQIRRFIAKVEAAQDEHEERTGDSAAWSAGVEEAFVDPAQFHADALAFVQAAAIKAHLAAGTVAVVANEGGASYAFSMLDRTGELLRADVFDLRRRLVALAKNPPEGRRNRQLRLEAHHVTTRLVRELEERIEPLLPLEPADTITVFVEASAMLGVRQSGTEPGALGHETTTR